MTKDKAIEQLKKWLYNLYSDTDIYHAVAMAIEALSNIGSQYEPMERRAEMKAEEITIDVFTNITVSDETAKRCLLLLEMWQEDNPNRCITKHISNDGSIKYDIEEVKEK